MITITSRLAAAALISMFVAGSAVAQTAAPAAKSEATTTEKKAQKPRSTESLECSKQADEKGLKGKERKKFRSQCMKAAKAGGAAAPSK